MKRILILCLVLFLGETAAHSAAVYFPPLRPANVSNEALSSYENTSASLPAEQASAINYSRITEIEQSLYGKTYQGQNIANRLSRIERSLFNKSYPSSTNLQRLDNVVSNYNQINRYPNISTNVLSKLERQAFNQTYPQYNTQRRLERLEQQILGATQSGDVNARYELLKTAARNYHPQSYAASDTNSLLNSMARNTTRRGMLGSLGGIGGIGGMGGVMTGFSPPINPYSAYGAGGNYSGYDPYSSMSSSPGYSTDGGYSSTGPFGFSRGYYSSNNSYGSGTGVTIID